jgi:hypothetical protein
MRNLTARLCLLCLIAVASYGATPIEVQAVKELKPTGSLGTCEYSATTQEQSFYKKVEPNELVTGSFMKDYDIQQETR